MNASHATLLWVAVTGIVAIGPAVVLPLGVDLEAPVRSRRPIRTFLISDIRGFTRTPGGDAPDRIRQMQAWA